MKDNNRTAVLDAIMTRRSVRNYADRQIPDDIVNRIIRAGIQAPTALNLQPWAFVVVQDRAFLDQVSAYCVPIMLEGMKQSRGGMSDEFRALLSTEGYSIYYHAPTVIMVVGRAESRFREIDCSLCAENMMLAAHALGIGSCWIGSTEVAYGNPELMQGFGIPEGYSPVGTIAFGYPAEEPAAHGRNEPLVTWVR